MCTTQTTIPVRTTKSRGKMVKKKSIEKIDVSHLLLENAFSTNSNLSWVLLMVDCLNVNMIHLSGGIVWQRGRVQILQNDHLPYNMSHESYIQSQRTIDHKDGESNRIMLLKKKIYNVVLFYATTQYGQSIPQYTHTIRLPKSTQYTVLLILASLLPSFHWCDVMLLAENRKPNNT